MKKTAIILLNLGGPSSLDEVRGFLFNLFYDKAIIRLPNPFRWVVAKIISALREEKAKTIYSQIGGASPILSQTMKQKNALEQALNDQNSKVFISMRYSSPFSFDTSNKLKEYKPDEIILLPLYPQFSTTTSDSSIKDMVDSLNKINFKGDIKIIGCYPKNKEFIEAHASQIKEILKKQNSKNYRILFSAHSLPEKIVKDGDPYQWQIEETVKDVVKKLKIKDLDYRITYQSKVTPVKWLEPSTEKEIEAAASEQKAVIIVPIAFVSEHSETLVELDIEYKKIAEEKGIEYNRVPALTANEHFIKTLAGIVKSCMKTEKSFITSDKMTRICPTKFGKCVCRGE